MYGHNIHHRQAICKELFVTLVKNFLMICFCLDIFKDNV